MLYSNSFWYEPSFDRYDEIAGIEEKTKVYRGTVTVNYNDFAGKVVNLDADITAGSDFAGAGVFSSTAANVKSFNGTLDGGGHTITLAINQTITGGVLTAGCAGLINDLGEAGIVKNLNVSGSVLGIHSATSGNMYVGGIAAYNRGTIQIVR